MLGVEGRPNWRGELLELFEGVDVGVLFDGRVTFGVCDGVDGVWDVLFTECPLDPLLDPLGCDEWPLPP